ncbi:hypothetical protein NC652_035993 [Populus alba x Populus x berolinensis]|nr:hypothetical protein NC652_035993 [Populus alba x Populus x berolinensis]
MRGEGGRRFRENRKGAGGGGGAAAAAAEGRRVVLCLRMRRKRRGLLGFLWPMLLEWLLSAYLATTSIFLWVDAVDDNLTNRSSTAAVMAPREKVEKAGYAPQSLLPVQKSQLELAPRNDSSGESTRRMHGDPGRNVVAAALPQHYSVLPDSIVWSSGAVTTAGVRSGGLMIMILQTFYESPSRKKAVKTPKWLACLLLLKYVAQLNHW